MSTPAQKTPQTRHPQIRELAGMSLEQRQALIWKRQVVEYNGRPYALNITHAARAWGAAHGFKGARGGWVYRGGIQFQGWGMIWRIYRPEIARWLLARAEHYPNSIPTP